MKKAGTNGKQKTICWIGLEWPRPAPYTAGRLPGYLRWLTRPGLVPSVPAVVAPAGVCTAGRRSTPQRVFQLWEQSRRACHWEEVSVFLSLGAGQWRATSQGPANGGGDIYGGPTLHSAGAGRKQVGSRNRQGGCRNLQSCNRDFEGRAQIKTKYAEQSFNQRIIQSMNQESINQRINQSTNQPIKIWLSQRITRKFLSFA